VPRPGWIDDFVPRVNARLEAWCKDARARAERASPEAHELVDAVSDLTLRGGKRLRAAALYAGMRSIDGEADPARALDAGAALELMQSYLLIQDDWMDQDDERRGGPSVHVALARTRGDARLGASLAILAGDVACASGWALLAQAPFPAQRLRDALAEYAAIHADVVFGQQLDLVGHPDIARVHRLKTGSYTVRGPLRLGALLADANAAQLEALDRFAEPIGIAFQLRDDLLGTFGATGAVGKPVGNDLRAGKRTSLAAEAESVLTGSDRALFARVFGNADASDDDVQNATEALVRTGVQTRIETRIAEADRTARAVLTAAPFAQAGKDMLADLAGLLTKRER
jgi:geranylgeranyl diphosphate synthase type I